MTRPDLKDLEVFAAVASARSFRGAAAKRGESASSLSDAVRRLETCLATRLLNRTTRSVTPTEAGQRLLESVAPALDTLTTALGAVGDDKDEVRGTLRLNVPVIVAQKILPPIAARFLARHPGVTLEVTADNNFIDVLASGCDAGIRYEERVERDMIAVPIGPAQQRFVLAAAPSYLADRGTPAHPHDLLDHACLRFRFASGLIASPWEFERGEETIKITPGGPLVSTSVELLIEAAIAGTGLVFMFDEFAGQALGDGRLQPVLADWWPSFSGPRLYYPSRLHNPPPLQAFLDFLREDRSRANKRSARKRAAA